MGAGRSSLNQFYFTFGRITYADLGPWKPSLAFYAWNDSVGIPDRFRSTVYELAYKLTRELTLEANMAATSENRVSWAQLHLVWER